MLTLWFVAAFGASAFAAPQYYSDCNTTVSTGQVPFSFPLSNGFPNVDASALKNIEREAHGTLPNSTLPSTIADGSAGIFELIAFNELFEVAFFANLIANITNRVPGYRIGDTGLESLSTQDLVLRSLYTILAQEELHALGANGILAAAGRSPIVPCQYIFPVRTFQQAIVFASTFTDVVLGTLQAAIHGFAVDGDVDFTNLIASVIGNEAEQEGFFRLAQAPFGEKVPSALPFLTASAPQFAFSALNQLIIAPGTCPNATDIKLPVFSPLKVASPYVSVNSASVRFNITVSNSSATDNLSLVYINQQNVPIVEALQNITFSDGQASFVANFPNDRQLGGLVIAALTSSPGPFANATEVAAATVFGPGLIELN